MYILAICLPNICVFSWEEVEHALSGGQKGIQLFQLISHLMTLARGHRMHLEFVWTCVELGKNYMT